MLGKNFAEESNAHTFFLSFFFWYIYKKKSAKESMGKI